MKWCIVVAYADDNVDKATISLTLANAALSEGDSVSVILMSEGVRLAVSGHADTLNNGEPFKPVAELISGVAGNGGELCVCMPCLKNRGVSEEDIDPRFTRIGGTDVLRILRESERVLQL
ncbi:MAG: hypothetical protein AMXMBFR82_45980 [Candidatus Hydrogenedentota bacterium]